MIIFFARSFFKLVMRCRIWDDYNDAWKYLQPPASDVPCAAHHVNSLYNAGSVTMAQDTFWSTFVCRRIVPEFERIVLCRYWDECVKVKELVFIIIIIRDTVRALTCGASDPGSTLTWLHAFYVVLVENILKWELDHREFCIFCQIQALLKSFIR